MMRKDFLSDFILNQFNCSKLEEVIIGFLDLIKTAQLMLSNDYYQIKITPTYEMKISGASSVRKVSSKVESLVIHKYDTMEKLEELIIKYPQAFNSLNSHEKTIFCKTFIDHDKQNVICDELNIYPYQYQYAKKSAMVKFCLFLGLEKYVDFF
ncbi:MAG: hypothetical protein GX265_01505 [Mollicutes bacterium]|nr:hypothetical protein [Mollicutes bacterium]